MSLQEGIIAGLIGDGFGKGLISGNEKLDLHEFRELTQLRFLLVS